MKKLLFCILLITFQCSVLLAQSDGAIYIDMTKPDHSTNNRFTVKLTNSESVCKIETAVSSSESYTIVISDYFSGSTVCDIDLITDGNTHTYISDGLPRGVYLLFIKTPSGMTSNKFIL